MSGPERTDGGNQGIQEWFLDEPVRLAQGTNLYDQFPFKEIIEVSYGIPEPDLRYTLTYLARDVLQPYFNNNDDTGRGQCLRQVFDTRESVGKVLPYFGKKYDVSDREQYPNLHKAMGTIVSELDIWNMWDSYVVDRLNALSGEYKTDGSFYTRKNRPEMAKSFLSWRQGKLNRHSRIGELQIAAILDDTFSQNRPQGNWTDQVPSGQNVRWKFRGEIKKGGTR